MAQEVKAEVKETGPISYGNTSVNENGSSVNENGASVNGNGANDKGSGASAIENGASANENGASVQANGTSVHENDKSMSTVNPSTNTILGSSIDPQPSLAPAAQIKTRPSLPAIDSFLADQSTDATTSNFASSTSASSSEVSEAEDDDSTQVLTPNLTSHPFQRRTNRESISTLREFALAGDNALPSSPRSPPASRSRATGKRESEAVINTGADHDPKKKREAIYLRTFWSFVMIFAFLGMLILCLRIFEYLMPFGHSTTSPGQRLHDLSYLCY